MSLAWVLREVQYFKVYNSRDSFTDPSCAESWEQSRTTWVLLLPGNTSLSGKIHTFTAINQNFKCRRLFAGPFECFQYVCISVSLCLITWAIFFLEWMNSFKINGAVTALTVPFPPQCLLKLKSPVQFELKVGKCSCQPLGLWPQTNFI